MIEDEVREQIVAIAEPPRTTPLAARSIDDRMARIVRRRRGAAAALGAAAVVGAIIVAQIVPFHRSTGAANGSGTVAVEAESIGVHGVFLSATLTFDRVIQLEQATYEAGGTESYHVDITTTANSADYPTPLPVEPGDEVMIEGSLFPSCADTLTDPLQLRVSEIRPDGGRDVETFVARDSDGFYGAVEDWCRANAHFALGDSVIEPDGSATVDLAVTNSSSQPILVKTPDLSEDGARWQSTTTTVAAGEEATIEIHGDGVNCRTSALPWAAGRLTVDGQPNYVPDDTQWC